MILGEAPLVEPGPVRAARFATAGAVDWERARRAAERVYADYYAVSPR
jgi:hypothetical protein